MNKKIITLICVISSVGIQAFAKTSNPRKVDSAIIEHPAQRKISDSQLQTSDADVALTRKIRDRLTDMDDLSTRAQNVTIITKGNNVTLKGEVDKQQEIQVIMNVAQETAQGKIISNQLRIHK